MKNKLYFCTNYKTEFMQKKILLLTLSVTLLSVAPCVAAEMFIAGSNGTELADGGISINVSGRTVTVSGAQGEKLEIVSLTGRVVKQLTIDAPSQSFELNIPKGCYILKVGKTFKKISVSVS